MLVFGEIIPKAVAREWATSLILLLYRPLTWASRWCWCRSSCAPTPSSIGRCAPSAARAPTARQFVSREELKALLQMEPERGRRDARRKPR